MDGSLVAYGFAQFITTTVAFKFLDFVYFGAIISATDPVTILTIFQVSTFQILTTSVLHSPPVDLYLISEKSIWKNQVRQTGFLVYFKLDFYCLCSLQKSISKLIFGG